MKELLTLIPYLKRYVAPVLAGVVLVVLANVTRAVDRLYALGARDVMVLNMPNIGIAPIVSDPALKIALDGLAQLHNVKLSAALGSLSATRPGLRIIPIDVYSFFKSLTETSSFNFTVPALPPSASFCLFDGATPTGINCPDVPTFNVDRRFFFWDIEHPTRSAHATIGAFLFRELKALVR